MRISFGILILLLLLPGCQAERAEFNEVKNINEVFNQNDWKAFRRIVKLLPEEHLPEMGPLFSELPNWSLNRESSIASLLKEERERTTQHWLTPENIERLENNRRISWAIEREHLSVRQFLGLAENLAAAIQASQISSENLIAETLKRARIKLKPLNSNNSVFSQLPRSQQYATIHTAGWLTRESRANWLSMVPIENIEFVKKYETQLKTMFPEVMWEPPLASIADPLDEYGIPFWETGLTGSDVNLKWDGPSENDETLSAL